ncbi:MAG TPA: DMT family transporter [Thermoanaerobaculia bacterium]|nr:DMT family transporter [Thermoanaerobaculia bacterium]
MSDAEALSPETIPAAAESPAFRVHLTLLLVQASFGGFHVVAKAVLSSLSPLALAGLRVGLATPCLVFLAWRRDRFVPDRRDLPMLALLGGLGVFANQILFINGLQHTTAINASILMPSLPVFAAAAAALLGIERLAPRRLAGTLLSVAGALVLVNPLRFATDRGMAIGNLMILANCLCYALYLVLQRPLLERIAWRTLTAWAFLFGGGAVVLLSLPSLVSLHAAEVPAGAWWGVAYIVALPTVFGYAASSWAVRRSSPALVAAYSTLQPLVAAVLAAWFLGERFGWIEGAGFALIVAGLWLVSAPRPEERRRQARL